MVLYYDVSCEWIWASSNRQGSYGSWKTWKVLEFHYGIFQDWKVLESPGKRPLVLESPGNMWNAAKNMNCMEGSKENWHWDLGIVEVNVNFRALEKAIWVLEKSWKFVPEKGYEPWIDYLYKRPILLLIFKVFMAWNHNRCCNHSQIKLVLGQHTYQIRWSSRVLNQKLVDVISCTEDLIYTVEPRFNEPLFNEVLDITNKNLRPGQNYSKMYGIEPWYNEPRYSKFLNITNIIRKPKHKIYLDITNYNVNTRHKINAEQINSQQIH